MTEKGLSDLDASQQSLLDCTLRHTSASCDLIVVYSRGLYLVNGDVEHGVSEIAAIDPLLNVGVALVCHDTLRYVRALVNKVALEANGPDSAIAAINFREGISVCFKSFLRNR